MGISLNRDFTENSQKISSCHPAFFQPKSQSTKTLSSRIDVEDADDKQVLQFTCKIEYQGISASGQSVSGKKEAKKLACYDWIDKYERAQSVKCEEQIKTWQENRNKIKREKSKAYFESKKAEKAEQKAAAAGN